MILDNRASLAVRVADFLGADLSGADVVLEPVIGESGSGPEFGEPIGPEQQSGGTTFYDHLRPGEYRISVDLQGYEPEVAYVHLGEGPYDHWFELGPSGGLFLYGIGYRRPVVLPDRPLIAVELEAGYTVAQLETDLTALGLELHTAPDIPLNADEVLVQYSSNTGPGAVDATLVGLQGLASVAGAALVITETSNAVTWLLDTIGVVVESGTSRSTFESGISSLGMSIVEAYTDYPDHILLRSNSGAGVGLLNATADVKALAYVVSVSNQTADRGGAVSLCPPVADYALTNEDTLYKDQWHLRVMGVPQAWQRLHNLPLIGGLAANDRTFGSHGIYVAVNDSGIPTRTDPVLGVVPRHPDLSPNITNGPKCAEIFDFQRLQPNHNVSNYPVSDTHSRHHGIQCTGLICATPNDGRGAIGVAGNVRLMPIVSPFNPVRYPDVYRWQFRQSAVWSPVDWSPVLTATGLGAGAFPALPARGADVASTSITWPTPIASVGSARAMLLRVTRYARNGRGGLLFFAVGNTSLKTLIRELSSVSYEEEAFGISGSSLFEVDDAGTRSLQERRSEVSSVTHPDDNRLPIEVCAPTMTYWPPHDNFNHRPATSWGGVGTAYFQEAMMGGEATYVSTTLSTATVAADTFIALQDPSAFVAGQTILIGPPDVNARHVIKTVITPTLYELNGTVGAVFAAGTDVRALSAKITELRNPASIADMTIDVDSHEGMWKDQVILVGAPTDPLARVCTLNADGANDRLSLTAQFGRNVNNADIYFLGGPEGRARLEEAFAVNADSGDTTITIRCTAGFWKGQGLTLGARGQIALRRVDGRIGEFESSASTFEGTVISDDVDEPRELDVEKLRYDHAVAAAVAGSHASYTTEFGGTSMACPLAAGVAALVLSAKMDGANQNSTLTWLEARDILRRTAAKIDLLNLGHEVSDADGAGRWFDRNDRPIVEEVGGVAELIDATAQTTLANQAEIGTVVLDVDDSSRFTPGHAVMIEPGANVETAIIRSVPDIHTIRLDRALARAHAAAATVTSGMATVTAVTGSAIDLNSNLGLVAGQAIQLGTGAGTDVRYIVEIPETLPGVPSTTRVLVDHGPKFAHAAGTSVIGGRVPDYNLFYGRGRVNADCAVAMAIDYSHDDRDLMMRNNLADDGVTPAARTPIDSPDIWVRTTDPATDTRANPTSYSVDGPHQIPNLGQEMWVCARVKNRGTKYPNVRAFVRFYVALSTGATIPGTTSIFKFPDDFPFVAPTLDTTGRVVQSNINSLYVATTPGSYFLGEVPIPEGAISKAGDPSGTDNVVLSVRWPAIPPVLTLNTSLKVYLLAHVSPNDGASNGPTPLDCNNITYRELVFTNIKFEGANQEALPDAIQVDSAGTAVAMHFLVTAQDVRQFDATDFLFQVTRTDGAITETITYAYAAGAWTYQPAKPAWLTMTAAPTSGMKNLATFEGDLALATANAGNTITIHAAIRDSGVVRLPKDKQISVYKLDGVPNTTEWRKSAPAARMHVFADMTAVAPQTPDEAFGPKNDKRFHVTSRFHSLTGSPVTAYAATRGIVLVQPVDDTFVNLVLRPIEQTAFGMLRVKYFIYRGLLKKHFVGSDPTKLLEKDDDNATPFIASLYDIDEKLSDALGVDETDPLPAKVIGYDPAAARTTKIEDYFFHVDTETDPKKGYQLALVQRGMEIGKFGAMDTDTAGQSGFGFEIVLEDGPVDYDIAYVRRRFVDIDITRITDAREKVAAQERILHYIDPAAYFGMHYHAGVFVPGQSKAVKEDALYTAVISKFFTKDTVYIDVRNENGYSYNYYGNYGLGTTPLANIKAGNRPSAGLTASAYGDFGWPIIRYTAASSTKETANAIFLALRSDDNNAPVAYVEGGLIAMPGKRKRTVGEAALLTAGSAWTNDIPIVVPNRPMAAGSNAAANIAGLVRMHYFRVHKAGAPSPPMSVVKSAAYHEPAFGPIDATPPWATIPAAAGGTSNPVTWESNGDRVFVDAVVATADPTNQMGYVAERGTAREDTKVVFYAAARDHYYWPTAAVPQTAVLVGGTANTPAGRTSFFNVAALYLNELKLDHTAVTIAPGTTTTLFRFKERDGSGDYPASNFLALGITTAQRDALAVLDLSNFSPRHSRYIIAEKVGNITDGALTFYEYRLGVRGWGTTVDVPTQRHTRYEAFPGTAIKVYSLDGLIFTSKAFGDLEAKVVPPTVAYTVEEQLYLDEGIPKEIIAASALQANVDAFRTEITTLAAAPQTFATLNPVIESHGADLFSAAVGADDDRPLYWARLAMRVILRDSGLPETARLIRVLEDASRGVSAAPFLGAPSAAKKRILLVGFDPHELRNGGKPNIRRSNPGAATALKLAATSFQSQAGTRSVEVHALVMPMRYADYDALGKEGIDYRFFHEFTDGSDDAHTIDAVITLATGANAFDPTKKTECYMARFATKTRGGDNDNDGMRTAASGSLEKGDDFYESNLPMAAVLPVEGGAAIVPDLYFDQTYEYNSSKTGRQVFANRKLASRKKVEEAPAAISDPNRVPTDASGDLSGGVGSAGNWLFNEVFYRIARLRDEDNDDLPTGHISLPRLQDDPAGYTSGANVVPADAAALVAKVQAILARIADAL